MATTREIRFRTLYLAVGVVLLIITVWALAVAPSPWWAVIPGFLCAGWWYVGIQAWVSRMLGHDSVGDAYRSGPQR